MTVAKARGLPFSSPKRVVQLCHEQSGGGEDTGTYHVGHDNIRGGDKSEFSLQVICHHQASYLSALL